jgi:hypothetical protein
MPSALPKEWLLPSWKTAAALRARQQQTPSPLPSLNPTTDEDALDMNSKSYGSISSTAQLLRTSTPSSSPLPMASAQPITRALGTLYFTIHQARGLYPSSTKLRSTYVKIQLGSYSPLPRMFPFLFLFIHFLNTTYPH